MKATTLKKLIKTMDDAMSSADEASSAWYAIFNAISSADDAADDGVVDVNALETALKMTRLAIDYSQDAAWFIEDSLNIAKEYKKQWM